MAAKKKILKLFIIIILAVFLLSTGLISVLYLGGSNNTTGTGDILSGDILSGDTAFETGALETGATEATTVDTGVDTIKTVEIGTVSPIIAGTGTK